MTISSNWTCTYIAKLRISAVKWCNSRLERGGSSVVLPFEGWLLVKDPYPFLFIFDNPVWEHWTRGRAKTIKRTDSGNGRHCVSCGVASSAFLHRRPPLIYWSISLVLFISKVRSCYLWRKILLLWLLLWDWWRRVCFPPIFISRLIIVGAPCLIARVW